MKITNEQQGILDAEITTTANFLKEQMKRDATGYYWETIHYDSQVNAFSEKFNTSIWNGTPGIIIFFLALYAHSKEEEYREIAKKATNRVLYFQEKSPTAHSSLFDGVAGMIYLCVKVFEQTADHSYLNRAYMLAMKHKTALVMEREDDLLGGKAGNLYAVTLLYHYMGDGDLLEMIKALVVNLIATAKLGKQGINWGTGVLSVAKLCGFSHGASGIAHVLLQVGTYFSEPGLVWLAEQALHYEEEYYNPDINNWMDLRWSEVNADIPRLFEWDKETFIQTNFDVNAWAHGAAGIGIAHLYAHRMTGKKEYKTSIDNALKRCLYDLEHQTKNSYLLFSGYGGLADFLMVYSQFFNNEAVYQKVITIGLNAIAHANLKGHNTWGIQGRQDLGLMTGTAGIGFMLLRIVDGGRFDSILQPTLPAPVKVIDNALGFENYHFIRSRIYDRYLGRTIAVLKDYDSSSEYLMEAADIDQLILKLHQKVAMLSSPERENARDLLHLESLTTALWKDQQGIRCFHTRLSLLKAALERYQDDAIFRSQKFVLNPFVKIFSSERYLGRDEKEGEQSNFYWNILYASDNDIHHFVMDKFPAIILFHLQKPMSMDELAAVITEELIVKHPVQLMDILITQVKELLERFFIRGLSD